MPTLVRMSINPIAESRPLSLGNVFSLDTGQVILVWGEPAPDALQPELRRWLTQEEQSRLQRFRNAGTRAVYASAHAVLNALLQTYTGTPARQLPFAYGPQQKPFLDLGHPGVGFNLSHSKGYFLIGLAKSEEIGVDVESHRVKVRIEHLAQQFFHPAEQAALRESLHPRQLFFDLWVRKEAFLKATGMGLSFPPTQFDATATSVDLPFQQIWLGNLPFFEHASAAFAVERERPSLQVRHVRHAIDWKNLLNEEF